MALRVAAPKTPTASVIFLHGLGDSGQGWDFLPKEFHQRNGLKHVNFVLPSAPERFYPTFDATVRGWFGWPMAAGKKTEDELFASAKTVKELINAEIAKGIDPSRIVIGGFSQGAAITQVVATTYSDTDLAGFVALSGFMPLRDFLEKHKTFKNCNAPTFIAHGTADGIVPIGEAVKSSDELTSTFKFSNVELHQYDGVPHSVSPSELGDIFDFLKKAIPEKF